MQETIAALQQFHLNEANKVPVKMYTPGQPDAQGTVEVQASKVFFALQNVFQQDECDNFVQVLYMGVFKCWEI